MFRGDRPRPDPTDDAAFLSEGLMAGTRLATPAGWIAVEALAPGDRLLTFDGPPCAVVALQSAIVDAGSGQWPVAGWPLRVPTGVLGNDHGPLRLLPDQAVMLDCDQAERMFGDAFALVPAAALAGWRGIAPEPPRALEPVITPILAADSLIFAEGNALVWCPGDTAAGLPGFGGGADTVHDRPGGTPLSLASARDLVACLIAEDVGAALSRAAPWGGQAALRVPEP